MKTFSRGRDPDWREGYTKCNAPGGIQVSRENGGIMTFVVGVVCVFVGGGGVNVAGRQ